MNLQRGITAVPLVMYDLSDVSLFLHSKRSGWARMINHLTALNSVGAEVQSTSDRARNTRISGAQSQYGVSFSLTSTEEGAMSILACKP